MFLFIFEKDRKHGFPVKLEDDDMQPLTGVRLLDLTQNNPYSSSVFADYGAEVIKVELPDGDPIRRRGSTDGADGLYQAYYNRGKKSLVVDWTKPEGQELLRRLAARVDMVVVNQAEIKMSLYALDYPSLKSVNPKLVYGVLTPFGEDGPWQDMPDYDLIVMARAGLMEKTGFIDKPTRIGFPIGYFYAGWHLVAGMLAAYLRAQDTGEGMKVSTSTWQCVMSVDDTYAQCLLGLNELPKRLGNGFPTTNPTDTFRCTNGWFSLSIGSDAQWWAFSRAAGKDVWAEDPRYSHDPVRSMENYFGDLDLQLKEYFSTITIEEADRICREAMVPGGPCNTVGELVHDEQVADRNMLVEVVDPVFGKTLQLGRAAKFSGHDEGDITPASPLGADTAAVLAQLQLAAEELSALEKAGVIHHV